MSLKYNKQLFFEYGNCHNYFTADKIVLGKAKCFPLIMTLPLIAAQTHKIINIREYYSVT